MSTFSETFARCAVPLLPCLLADFCLKESSGIDTIHKPYSFMTGLFMFSFSSLKLLPARGDGCVLSSFVSSNTAWARAHACVCVCVFCIYQA